MTKIITTSNVKKIIKTITLKHFLLKLIQQLEIDFSNWESFQKMARPAFHSENGVVELMPIADSEYFGCKTVNGHPSNSLENKMCVVATGQLNRMNDGYPILLSEMTLLTALRTAATSAMASKYLARKDSKVITIIGCGAQSEFQIVGHLALFEIHTVYYYDIDPTAMEKFAKNLGQYNLQLIKSKTIEENIEKADIIITCIAEKSKVKLFNADLVRAGTHINGIGGDCPGKTELDMQLLEIAKVFVEFTEQTMEEGEIQNYKGNVKEIITAELWEVITRIKPGRSTHEEITLFDAVGFAIEDFSVLKFIDQISTQLGVFESLNMIPELVNSKNLFGEVSTRQISFVGQNYKQETVSQKLI
jgi:ornithine cyclodeaminase